MIVKTVTLLCVQKSHTERVFLLPGSWDRIKTLGLDTDRRKKRVLWSWLATFINK